MQADNRGKRLLLLSALLIFCGNSGGLSITITPTNVPLHWEMHSNYTVLACEARIILMGFLWSFFFQIKLFFFSRLPQISQWRSNSWYAPVLRDTEPNILRKLCFMDRRMSMTEDSLWLKASFSSIHSIYFVWTHPSLKTNWWLSNVDPINHSYWFYMCFFASSVIICYLDSQPWTWCCDRD